MPDLARPARFVIKVLAGVLAYGPVLSPAASQGDPSQSECCDSRWAGFLDDLERHIDALRSPADRSDSEVGKHLELYFLREAERRGLTDWSGLTDAGLATLFEAAHVVAFHAGSPASADRLQEIHRALERRGVATSEQGRQVVRALITVRRFDQARELADESRLGLAVPRVVAGELHPAAPSVLRFADAETLVHESLDLAEVRLVVVGSPKCGFFRGAVADLASDPALSDWLRRNAVVLLPPAERLDPDPLVEWNNQHPDLELHVPYAADQWPWISRWSTPGFYMLAEGALQEHFIGWPNADSLGRLRAMIEAGGGIVGPLPRR